MRKILVLLSGFAALAMHGAARAETLKVAIPQKGAWETEITTLGVLAGLFKAEGIEIEPLYTRGGSETVQAVLAGSVDMAVANGILGTIGGFAKGAPIRVTASSMTGTPDVFWYAKPSSGIKSLKDAQGKTIGFSQPGSSTHLIIQALLEQYKIKAKIVPSGAPTGSFTMVMSDQIDVGWAVPPFRLQDIADGKVQIVARGTEAPALQNQSVRVHVTSANTLRAKRDLLVRFHRALQKSLDYAYSDDKALLDYSKLANVPVEIARKARDEFHPKAHMQMKQIRGLDLAIKQAIDFKFLDKPMTPDDLKGMIDVLAP